MAVSAPPPDIKVPANPEPVDGVFTKDVVIDSAANIWSRLFIPTREKTTSSNKAGVDGTGGGNADKKQAVILFYHGGGFLIWAPDTSHYDLLCRKISKRCDAVVVSPNYRLAPQFPYPTAYDDCYKAFDWLRSPESRSHLPATADVSQCVLLGDSAGGNIVHFMACRAAENDISPVQIRAIVELQPFFGGEEVTSVETNSKSELTLADTHFFWKEFLPGQNRDHPNVNVFGPNSRDISALPLAPILVVTGSLDILIERNETYVQKLREIGKDVTVLNYEADHGLFIASADAGLSAAGSALAKLQDEAIEAVSGFIRSKTHQG